LMGLQIHGVHFVQPFFEDFHLSIHFFEVGLCLLWSGVHLFYTGLRHFLAGHLFSPAIHSGFHPFLMGI
jgi:hypothetical protein